jgi:uncharacterized protein (TIGR00251 family)
MASLAEASYPPCVTSVAGGLILSVIVVPGASRSEVIGLHDNCLRIRLAAPAIEGRANDELVSWLADQLGVPRRQLSLHRGLKSRRKQVLMADLPWETLRPWLSAVLAPADGQKPRGPAALNR